MNYDVIVTSVRDRADLLDRTLRSMLVHLDLRPAQIIVHEDHRAGVTCPAKPTTRELLDAISLEFAVPYVLLERNPGTGLARAIHRALEWSKTELLFYTQEDFDFLRPLPIRRGLEIAAEHNLNLIRFNKQKTEWCKGEDRPPAEQWHAVEVEMSGQKFVINDRWCHQPSIWRRSIALQGYRTLCASVPEGRPVDRCEDKFDRWMNQTIGGGCACVDGHQPARRDLCRTFIWGPIKEPAFIRHTGGDRRSQGWDK